MSAATIATAIDLVPKDVLMLNRNACHPDRYKTC
jgi:hypothetical protein